MTFDPSQPRVPAGESGGGRWGKPRDSKAAAAQKDTKGRQLADVFADLEPAARAAFLAKLSDSDLQKLTGVVYSSKTSDPKVVSMRNAVTAAMTKRGISVQDFGALGGGIPKGKGKPPTPDRDGLKQLRDAAVRQRIVSDIRRRSASRR